MSSVQVWDGSLKKELTNLSHKEITPPRNAFLYKAHFWPLDDLVVDANDEMAGLVGDHLDTDEKGFLIRLCFTIYRLFEQIMGDLGERSPVVKEQIEHSRCLSSDGYGEMECYRGFLGQVSVGGPEQ